MILSVCVVYSEQDVKWMETLTRSLPRWAEWVFLKSVKSYNNEIILDMDNEQIRKGTYYYKEWDFAKAKNEAKCLCHGDWILFLDADEHLDILQHDWLKELLENTPEEVGGYYCTQYNWYGTSIISDQQTGLREGICTVRLVRNIPPVKFKYPIHEVLDPSILDSGYLIQDCNLRILHDGYIMTKDGMKDKLARNIKAIWQNPNIMNEDNGRYWMYLIESCSLYKKLME